MVGKTKTPNQKEREWMDAIKDIGCIPCRKMGYYDVPADVQHVLSGGKRKGHMHSYGSCPYHHRGIDEHGLGLDVLYRILGPSFALNKKEFQEKFGTEEELVWEQDRLYRLWKESFI